MYDFSISLRAPIWRDNPSGAAVDAKLMLVIDKLAPKNKAILLVLEKFKIGTPSNIYIQYLLRVAQISS